MIAQPKHGRKLVLGGASLTKARLNRNSGYALDDTRDDLEQVLLSSGYLEGAPFSWVGIMLRYGLINEDAPHYQRIDRKDGELPLAIELDTHEIIAADREELRRMFTIASLKALIHAGKKYQRPTGALEARYAQLADDTPRP